MIFLLYVGGDFMVSKIIRKGNPYTYGNWQHNKLVLSSLPGKKSKAELLAYEAIQIVKSKEEKEYEQSLAGLAKDKKSFSDIYKKVDSMLKIFSNVKKSFDNLIEFTNIMNENIDKLMDVKVMLAKNPKYGTNDWNAMIIILNGVAAKAQQDSKYVNELQLQNMWIEDQLKKYSKNFQSIGKKDINDFRKAHKKHEKHVDKITRLFNSLKKELVKEIRGLQETTRNQRK